jgi:SAM-dependent methyltransferase
MKKRMNHWLRKVMEDETHKIVAGWPVSSLDAIEISGKGWSGAGFKSYVSLQYPEFDICTPSEDWSEATAGYARGSADLILAEQVWEHLRYPYRAGRNVLGMLRPGGRFLLTTPFLVRIHNIEYYSDCTRWTAEGMQYYLEECGFDPAGIQTYAWGNRDCAAAHITSPIWSEYRRGMNLENEPLYPCVVWAVATKRA